METVGATRAGFLLARTRAGQSGQRSDNQGQELVRSEAMQITDNQRRRDWQVCLDVTDIQSTKPRASAN